MQSVDAKILTFSKDRAAQLLLLLDTIGACCLDFANFEMVVLYKTSDEKQEDQYQEVAKLHPSVVFQKEMNLEKDVRSNLSQTDFILFLVDDCIFVNKMELKDVISTLELHPDCLGFSLRLGKNTVNCYPFRCSQKIPDFVPVNEQKLKFNWTTSEYDFGYPLELSSSVYRVQDISKILSITGFQSVNHFESVIAAHSNMFRKNKPNLLCYEQSRSFCNPLNIVGCPESNQNRHSKRTDRSALYLSSCFANGLKIDPHKFIGYVPNGCHQEAELSWVER